MVTSEMHLIRYMEDVNQINLHILLADQGLIHLLYIFCMIFCLFMGNAQTLFSIALVKVPFELRNIDIFFLFHHEASE